MNKQNKIALVTGGSRGLGRDMAINLAKKGIDVVITYKSNQQAAESVVAEIENSGHKALSLQLDVADHLSYDDFFNNKLQPQLQEKFNTNKFDFLVNNAGTIIFTSYDTATPEQFKDMVHIHLMAAFFVSQKALKMMNDGGGIINISTGLTRIINPGFVTYAIMKGAIETLTRYQAKELGERKIRVNTVAPGAIETDIMGGVVRDNPEMNAHIASNTALGRVGLPTDIGPVVAFLCSDDANWINAQRIEVSGGQAI
jgi:NAD(P)-dependent dehydrogenase (short-subunit alcohol dehydrogenase family)